jgi:hypothetical protein
MIRFSGELDPMKMFKIDFILYLLTNMMVSSTSKSIDETTCLRFYKESQGSFHLHRKLNLQNLSQFSPLRKK